MLLVRSRLRNARASLWLDGLIGAVATTALAAALAYGPVIHEGSAGDLSPAVLTGLAYPVGDLLLLGMIVAIFGLSAGAPGGRGSCSASGSPSTPSATASTSSRPRTAPGRTTAGSNALWPASSLLVGLAAWQPIKRRQRPQGSEPAAW